MFDKDATEIYFCQNKDHLGVKLGCVEHEEEFLLRNDSSILVFKGQLETFTSTPRSQNIFWNADRYQKR